MTIHNTVDYRGKGNGGFQTGVNYGHIMVNHGVGKLSVKICPRKLV
jgi:hypothetical protein